MIGKDGKLLWERLLNILQQTKKSSFETCSGLIIPIQLLRANESQHEDSRGWNMTQNSNEIQSASLPLRYITLARRFFQQDNVLLQ